MIFKIDPIPIDLDLYMPTCNRKVALELTFRELLKTLEPLPISWRLIVVDNGSTDGTLEFINEYKNDHVCVVHLDKNYGIETPLGDIIQQSNAKYIGKMDDDMLFTTPGWPLKLIEAVNAGASAVACCHLWGVHPDNPNHIDPTRDVNITASIVRLPKNSNIQIMKISHVGGHFICDAGVLKKHWKGIWWKTQTVLPPMIGYLWPFIYIKHLGNSNIPGNILTKEWVKQVWNKNYDNWIHRFDR